MPPSSVLQPACHTGSRGRSARAQASTRPADWRDMSVRIAPLISLVGSVLLAGCSSVSVLDPIAQAPVRDSVETPRGGPAGPPWIVSRRAQPAKVMVQQLQQAPTNLSSDTALVTTDLTAVGFASITAQSGTDPAQRRLQAARAAKLDAYRSLAEQLYGVRFASDSVIIDTRVREDHIRSHVEGVIAGAEIVALEPLGNDTYQATVKLPAARAALLQRRSP